MGSAVWEVRCGGGRAFFVGDAEGWKRVGSDYQRGVSVKENGRQLEVVVRGSGGDRSGHLCDERKRTGLPASARGEWNGNEAIPGWSCGCKAVLLP